MKFELNLYLNVPDKDPSCFIKNINMRKHFIHENKVWLLNSYSIIY
jgi:hypothetical protein